MKTRFHVERFPELRTVPKIGAHHRDMRILRRKTTFHMSCADSKSAQRVNDKQLPRTGLTTTNFQYSKNLASRDHFENTGSTLIAKLHPAA
jgi:hypothetical protein